MKHLFRLIGLAVVFASCGSNGSGSSAKNAKKEEIPVSYETAFQNAYCSKVSSVPDTLLRSDFTGA